VEPVGIRPLDGRFCGAVRALENERVVEAGHWSLGGKRKDRADAARHRPEAPWHVRST
jgi:hypothetical protein